MKTATDDFADKVKSARERLDWTQEHLADEIKKFTGSKIHKNTILNVEKKRGRTSKETARLIKETISHALKCEYPWDETGRPISQHSLLDFINRSNVVARIDSALVGATRMGLVSAASFIDVFQNRMEYLKMHSLESLERHLAEREKLVVSFGTHLYRKPDVPIPFIPRGACIALLQLLSVIETKSHEELVDFLRKYSIIVNVDPGQRAVIIRNAFEAAKKDVPST